MRIREQLAHVFLPGECESLGGYRLARGLRFKDLKIAALLLAHC